MTDWKPIPLIDHAVLTEKLQFLLGELARDVEFFEGEFAPRS